MLEEKILAGLGKQSDEVLKAYFSIPSPAYRSPFITKETSDIAKFFKEIIFLRPDHQNNPEKYRNHLTLDSDILIVSSFLYPFVSQKMVEEIYRAMAWDMPILIFPVDLKKEIHINKDRTGYEKEILHHVMYAMEVDSINLISGATIWNYARMNNVFLGDKIEVEEQTITHTLNIN